MELCRDLDEYLEAELGPDRVTKVRLIRYALLVVFAVAGHHVVVNYVIDVLGDAAK